MGRKVPRSRRRPDVIHVTGEVDLRKEPLDFKDSFGAHENIVEAGNRSSNQSDFSAAKISIWKSGLLP